MQIEGNLKKVMNVMGNKFGIRIIKQILCVVLLIFGVDEKIIMERLGTSPLSIKKYEKLLKNNKIEELFTDNVYRQKSELENYKEQIIAQLDKKTARTLREAAGIIEKTTGLKRSLPQVRNFLKKTATSR